MAQWLSDDLQRLPTRFAYSGLVAALRAGTEMRDLEDKTFLLLINTRAFVLSKTARSWARHSLVRQARNPPKPPTVNHTKPDGSIRARAVLIARPCAMRPNPLT